MFNMTDEERKVVLFLVIVALLGAGVKFLSKQFSSNAGVINTFQKLGKINLNTADKKMLMSISGIGEKLAERIIKYRQERSGFEDLEDLKSVKGVTPSKFNKVSSYLFVE